VGERSIRRWASASCLTLVCATAPCVAAGDESFEEHHAHEHGVATLDIAIDGAQLALRFHSPAMNLLGFEHPPRSAQDDAAVSRAVRWLSDPAAQFQPSADAGCRLAKSEVTPPDWKYSTEHSDFAAAYEFSCRQPAALQHLDVRLLQHLDAGMKIEVQIASREGQHGAELTRSNTRLALRGRSK
jgi:hypothetical protein